MNSLQEKLKHHRRKVPSKTEPLMAKLLMIASSLSGSPKIENHIAYY